MCSSLTNTSKNIQDYHCHLHSLYRFLCSVQQVPQLMPNSVSSDSNPCTATVRAGVQHQHILEHKGHRANCRYKACTTANTVSQAAQLTYLVNGPAGHAQGACQTIW